MATNVTRETTQTDGTSPKGSPLTNAEVDTNFINLNDDKVEVSGAIIFEAQAGEALAKGDVVYVSGVSGNTPVVSKADADDANKMPAYGLAEDAANLNAAVNIVTFGTLYDLDTSSFSAGDTVYVSTTAGSLTTTKPSGESSLIQNVGTVIRSHASAGSIKVGGAGRTNDTPNLNDGNVFIGNASNQAVARALTGDDISDGTITSFASTGIDDNATSTAITIASDEAVTFANDIELPDNGKAIFGASSDLQIYHDGTNSWVKETNASGSFFVDAANLYLRTDDGQAYLAAVKDSYVRLYHDDSVKLETTSTGIDVTGDVNSDSVTTGTFTSTGIDDNATSNAITIDTNENVGIGGIASPQAPLHIYKTETSVGETDPIARFERFTSGDNAYLDITVDNDNNLIGFQSTGTSDGGFTFGGAATERMRLTSAGKLGILTDNPARELDIKLAQDTLTTLGQKGGINLYAPSNTVGNGGEITWSSAINGEVWAAISGHIISNGSGTAGGDLVFATATNAALPTERMRLDNAGNFGIGVTDPTATLDVNGTIKLSGSHPVGTRNTALGNNAFYSAQSGASYNVAVGFQSMYNNTTGTHNVGIGYNALVLNTTGHSNSALGFSPLSANTTGLYNVAIGYEAMRDNTTANNNVAVGYQSSHRNTTGAQNVAVGRQALYFNTTGNNNAALGDGALFANTASENTAVGYGAAGSNTTGTYNTAVGRASLFSNTTAGANTALGYGAMGTNTTGSNNTGLGFNALNATTTGSQNVAVGSAALDANTIGAYNTAVGYGAAGALTTDYYNVAVGFEALGAFTTQGTSGNVAVGGLSQRYATSYYNVAVGYQSAQSVTSHSNTAVGHRALLTATAATENSVLGTFAMDAATTGSYSTAIGAYSLSAVTTGSYNTAIGRNAHGGLTTGSNNVAVGSDAGYSITTGTVNTHIGVEAGYNNTTGSHNVAVGYQAGRTVGVATGTTYVGNYAGRLCTGNSNVGVGYAAFYLTTTADNCTGIGNGALYNTTTGSKNTAVGSGAMQINTTGNSNVGIGYQAGYGNTTGAYNNSLGYQALYTNLTGTHNVAVGYQSLFSTTSSDNTAVGNYSLYSNISGTYNVAMGYTALYSNTASYNTAIGYQTLDSNTTGSFNTAIGTASGEGNTTGQYNTHGGYNAGDYGTTGSNNTNFGAFAGQQNVTGGSNTNVGYNAGGATTSSYNVMLGMNAGDTNTGGAGNIVIGYAADVHTASANYAIALGYGCISVGSQYFTFGTGSGNDRVYNQFTANASWTRVSDQRYKKEIIENADCGLSFINDLRPVTFKWKAKSEIDADLPDYDPEKTEADYASKMYGLIAQEVKEAMDKHGITDFAGWHEQEDSGIQGISQEMFIHPLIKAVQELSAKVDALEAQLSGE